jgi:hypothetical protein
MLAGAVKIQPGNPHPKSDHLLAIPALNVKGSGFLLSFFKLAAFWRVWKKIERSETLDRQELYIISNVCSDGVQFPQQNKLPSGERGRCFALAIDGGLVYSTYLTALV